MLSANTETGEVLYDKEIRAQLASQKPYAKWVDENRVELKDFTDPLRARPNPRNRTPGTLPPNRSLTASQLKILTWFSHL